MCFLGERSCALGISGVDLVGSGCYGAHWGCTIGVLRFSYALRRHIVSYRKCNEQTLEPIELPTSLG